MRKTLRNRKALSPVIAAIILIAVTVAVSIAVAAWMGSITIGFMQTEELQITAMTFTESALDAKDTITLSVKNIGTGKVTIVSATVNDKTVTMDPTSVSYEAGDPAGTIVLTQNWIDGNRYKVTLMSSTGTVVATYQKTA